LSGQAQVHDTSGDPPIDEVLTDPDPFTIGLGIFGAIAGGGSFLEARRLRQSLDQRQRESFRESWYACRRTLIHFRRVVDEFDTYVLEDGYGKQSFRIGAVRISVGADRHKAMRRLNGQAMMTATHMSDDLDELSAFLGPEDQPQIDAILERLDKITIPEIYRDLIKLARDLVDVYSGFLEGIGDREDFEADPAAKS
jgi:hypothetical protein